jgi:cupin fold WbuC family metalloprotein
MKIIDNELLNKLTEQAKASPRLRMNYDLRTSENDKSQRMLNALEPGTQVPIHRHQTTTEVVIMLRGSGIQWIYDEQGNPKGKVLLQAGGPVNSMSVDKGEWHRIESLETGTVIFEAKDGAFEPIAPEDIMQ